MPDATNNKQKGDGLDGIALTAGCSTSTKSRASDRGDVTKDVDVELLKENSYSSSESSVSVSASSLADFLLALAGSIR